MLEHAGLPSCFWIFAVWFWCFMDNTEVRDGESAWNLRHGTGHFDKPRLPFGCLVDFLPKPDSVKAMPKFEPRANQGILVGYRLHPGGKWARDYQVFPLHYFAGYDYNRPRNLLELVPVHTQECKLVGEVSFPCKRDYDIFKRALPSMHPLCIIHDAEHYDCDTLDDKEDTEDDNVEPAEDQPTEPAVPVDGAGAASGVPSEAKRDDNDDYHLRQDAVGRHYKYDVHGNRMYAKPLHGTLRPASLPQSVWKKLNKAE